ncbi:MAG TPA: hypothetical protein VFJ00_01945 [Candidatus Limnocylindria bacterium]|nr:hypothetical protein [Candidatus Limnocylindria bacterium]
MTNSAEPAVLDTERVARLRRAAPALLLLLLLALASLLSNGTGGLQLASPDRSRVDQLRRAIGELPNDALVLIAFDADLGTYPEIRAATRVAIDDLAAHDARLAIVSFTPDGRAIAAAERDRIARGAGEPPADLGFVAGAEAGLVRSIASVVPESAQGPTADAIRDAGGGIGAFAMVLVVSGSDISARSWVEQVGSRLPELPLVAIAPTFLDPELEPYLRSGQLTALLATLRDGVAYVEAAAGSAGSNPGPTPGPLPMLVGMLAAIAVLAEAALRRFARRRGRRPKGRAPA